MPLAKSTQRSYTESMAKRKTKRGGKRKTKAVRRIDTIRFRVNEGERQLLEVAAAKEKLELSAWMRSVLLKRAEELESD